MIEKEYTIHKMIEGYPTASDCINSYVKELIKQDKFVEDITVAIHHKGQSMTYKECCDTLNQLTEENKYLREKINTLIKDETDLGLNYGDIVNIRFLNTILDDQRKEIKELHNENNKLTKEITDLKYNIPKEYSEREIRKAVRLLNTKYRSCEKMDFHDMLLIENLLMNLEMILFNGEVHKLDDD